MSYDNTWLCLFNFRLWTAERWNREISLAPFKTLQPTHHEKTPTQTLPSTLQEDTSGPLLAGRTLGAGGRLELIHKFHVPPHNAWLPLARVSGTPPHEPWPRSFRQRNKTCPSSLDDRVRRRGGYRKKGESHDSAALPFLNRGDPLDKSFSLKKPFSLVLLHWVWYSIPAASKACSPGSGERNWRWELDCLPKTTQQDLGAGNVSTLPWPCKLAQNERVRPFIQT